MEYKTFKLYLLNNVKTTSHVYIYEYNNETQGQYLSEEEENLLNDGNIEPSKTNMNIHMDDSIENVKYKITSILEDKNTHNYYFFYQTENSVSTKDLFYILQNRDNVVSNRSLSLFIKNTSF